MALDPKTIALIREQFGEKAARDLEEQAAAPAELNLPELQTSTPQELNLPLLQTGEGPEMQEGRIAAETPAPLMLPPPSMEYSPQAKNKTDMELRGYSAARAAEPLSNVDAPNLSGMRAAKLRSQSSPLVAEEPSYLDQALAHVKGLFAPAGPPPPPPAPLNEYPQQEFPGAAKEVTPTSAPASAPKASPRPTLATKKGISIGDRPGMGLEGAPQQGIGLELTSDRHASLQDPALDSPEGLVPNKQLSEAVNLAGPGSEAKQVAQHAQEVVAAKAPEDRSNYYAALRDMENVALGVAGLGKGQMYDTLIGQEAQAQKTFQTEEAAKRQALAAALKQRFEGEQKALDRGITSARDKRLGEHYGSLEGGADVTRTETERHNRAMEARKPSGGLHLSIGQQLADERGLVDLEKALVQPGTVDAFNRIAGRLEDETPLYGVGALPKAVQGVAEVLPFGVGDKLSRSIGNMARSLSAEGQALHQDAIRVMQQITLDTTGKAMTDRERADIEARLGMAGGDENSFRAALKNELQAAKARADRQLSARNPRIQKAAKERGIVPDWSARGGGALPYAYEAEGRFGEAERAATGEYVKKYAPTSEAVKETRAQEDEEERIKRRPK